MRRKRGPGNVLVVRLALVATAHCGDTTVTPRADAPETRTVGAGALAQGQGDGATPPTSGSRPPDLPSADPGSSRGDQEALRARIQNDDPTVKPGNLLPLGSAAAPFAIYISAIHENLHPIFVDRFLSGLSGVRPSDPLADPKLSTLVELVLVAETGAVAKLGVVRSSGVTAFDIGVLDALLAAGPYGRAPAAVVSSDGNVYLHWELFRDPQLACSARFATPFLLDPRKK